MGSPLLTVLLLLLIAGGCGPSTPEAQGGDESQATETGEARVDPALLSAIDWYTGVAGSVDDARAKELLEEAVEDGDPLSTMWLARVYSRGRMGFERDTIRAQSLAEGVIDEVEELARAGVLEAVFLMGTAFDEALGRPFDPAQAALWHHRAAERGHVLGSHNMGNQLSAGRGIEENPAEAVRWWRAAAEEGDAITQLRLGESFEAGRGVEMNLDSALVWYERSAEAGNERAREALERIGSTAN